MSNTDCYIVKAATEAATKFFKLCDDGVFTNFHQTVLKIAETCHLQFNNSVTTGFKFIRDFCFDMESTSEVTPGIESEMGFFGTVQSGSTVDCISQAAKQDCPMSSSMMTLIACVAIIAAFYLSCAAYHYGSRLWAYYKGYRGVDDSGDKKTTQQPIPLVQV